MPPLFDARRLYNVRAAGHYHASRGVSRNVNCAHYSVHEIALANAGAGTKAGVCYDQTNDAGQGNFTRAQKHP